MNQTKMFKQFNELYGVGEIEPTRENLEKALGLILDEVKEAYEELYMGVVIDMKLSAPREEVNLKNAAKELTDIRYITGERATAFKFDVDALDKEVHRSNMSKCLKLNFTEGQELAIAKERYPHAKVEWVNGKYMVLRCQESKKLIKPTTYSPANITDEMIGN